MVIDWLKQVGYGSRLVRLSSVSQTVGRDPKVGREVLSSGSPKFFLEIFIFCHLFVNWIRILFTSYHCYRSSPLS